MLEPIPNNPIVNAGLLYVNGLQIANPSSNTASKTLILTQGAARDSTNTDDIILTSSVILNGATVGANACDTAPLVANTLYAVYAIDDSTEHRAPAGLFSLASNTGPFLPSGYDMFRRIGWVLTDGAANILIFTQLGIDENRTYYYKAPITVLVTGASTTYAAVNLSSAVPPMRQTGLTATNNVFFNVLYAQSSLGNFVQFHYNTFTSPPPGIVFFSAGVVTTGIEGSVIVPSQNQQIVYRVGSGDSLTLSVTGYTDYLS